MNYMTLETKFFGQMRSKQNCLLLMHRVMFTKTKQLIGTKLQTNCLVEQNFQTLHRNGGGDLGFLSSYRTSTTNCFKTKVFKCGTILSFCKNIFTPMFETDVQKKINISKLFQLVLQFYGSWGEFSFSYTGFCISALFFFNRYGAL